MSRHIRDIVLLIAGLLGIGYETVFQKVDRPELLVVFTAMIGLPIFFRADDYRRDDRFEPPQRRNNQPITGRRPKREKSE